MTKLLEWLAIVGIIASIWLSLVTNKIESSMVKQYPTLALFSPVIFVVLFGLYAVVVVLYRVLTFNNCEAAAAELQEEIREAKTELGKLGFQFKEVK